MNKTNGDFKILIVDDEEDITELVEYNLKKEGYQTLKAHNGREAYEKALIFKPQLILMDVMMPEMNGIETCKKIRSTKEIEDSLVIFLSARSDEDTEIQGFEVGGNDYIKKPIRMSVLVKRIQSILRRFHLGFDNMERIILGNLEIDKEKFLVVYNDQSLELPVKQFKLLLLLASNPDRVFSREEIFDNIWKDESFIGLRNIDVHIHEIRKALGNNCIKTINGVGYKLDTQKLAS